MGDTATSAVSSGADLAAVASPDIFSGIPDDAGDSIIDTPDDLEGDTASTVDEAGEGGEGEGSEEQETAPATETEPATPPAAAPTTEELPEGVTRGKDRNGKPGLFVEEPRWKTVYGNHQLVQRASEMLGEPITPEALQLRQESYIAQERLFTDLTSGDPQAQGKLLTYFLDEMARAREVGEVGVDPAVPFAQTVYSTLREKAPDAYATLRFNAAKDLLQEMYEEASAKGDEALWISAQHFARALANVDKGVTDIAQMRTIAQRMGIPFYAKAEMPGLARGFDPVARLQADNARLQAQLNGSSNNHQAAQLDGFFAAVSKNVRAAVLADAVKPALASVENAWKNFPSDFKDLVVDRLHRKVAETINADTGFSQRIRLLDDQARRATSAQRREEIGQSIQQAYVNRAKLAVEAVKKPILEFAANRLQERSNQNHERLQNAQTRTLPKGPTSTVPRSLTPNGLIQMKDGMFDPDIAVKQARQLIFGRG